MAPRPARPSPPGDRAVHLHLIDADDLAQPRAVDDPHAVARLVTGIRCSWARAPGTSSGMCWISVPPSTTCSSCWPPQMPSTGMFRSSARQVMVHSNAVRASLVLTVECRSAAEQRRIDVESAAGHDQPLDQRQIVLGPLELVRQQHRRAPRVADRPTIILAQRQPRELGIPPGLLAIERDADDGRGHAGLYGRRASRATRTPGLQRGEALDRAQHPGVPPSNFWRQIVSKTSEATKSVVNTRFARVNGSDEDAGGPASNACSSLGHVASPPEPQRREFVR